MDTAKMPLSLCCVLMPSGRPTDHSGRVTDFDSVFDMIIKPAIAQAGLEAIRAERESIGARIDMPVFERLMLCHYAVADITGAGANVFYALGLRQALRPASTVVLFAEGAAVPFDAALLPSISYRINSVCKPAEAATPMAALAAHLTKARSSPHGGNTIFKLVEMPPQWQVDHMKTDLFRVEADYSITYKTRLAEAVRSGRQAVERIAAEPALKNLDEVEVGIIVDLYLSLRDVKAYDAMIELYRRMPLPLQRTRMVREQLGFALNRAQKFEQAKDVIDKVIEEFGPSSETNALLGRLYKDRWDIAKAAGRADAESLLHRAIDAYVAGFEADWRDAYPGVNALSLMELGAAPDPRQAQMLPVVRYAVLRKAAKNPDYWDYATLVELAVLGNDRDGAQRSLADAIDCARHAWEVETTKRNLGLIRGVREARHENSAWVKAIEDELQRAADALKPAGGKA